jgi:hypothetical protein
MIISALGGTLFLLHGYMVTAFHVFPAPLPTSNEGADVIALDLGREGLKSDCRELVIGETLTIVGYPQGEFAIAQGEYLGTEQRPNRYISHKASYPGTKGFSGSPVFDKDFEVVGVHTHYRREGGSLFTSICEVENLIK